MLAAQPQRKNIAIPLALSLVKTCFQATHCRSVWREPVPLFPLSVWRSPHCMRLGRCLKCYKYKSSVNLVYFNARSFSFYFSWMMTGLTQARAPTSFDVSPPTSSRPPRWRLSSTLTPEDPSSSAAGRPKAAQLTVTSDRAQDVTLPCSHLEVRAAGTPCSTCRACRSSRCWPN